VSHPSVIFGTEARLFSMANLNDFENGYTFYL